MKQVSRQLDFATHLDFSAILTNPILDIAARVWEADRYEAFRTCYRSMRRIDDLVDHRRALQTPITPEEIIEIEAGISQWVAEATAGRSTDQFTTAFLATLADFRMPLWPWERLCRAMIYDLTNNGFSTFHQFLRYCEGAAISPAAVFMHLCGVRGAQGERQVPPYDIRLAARPLAIFSYLVHLMRDFEKDQREGLNYFSDDILRRNDLTREQIRELAINQSVTKQLRGLMSDYHWIAGEYQVLARRMVDKTLPLLAPRYQLSLELIYSLYSQIFEQIDPVGGRFTTAATNPSPEAIESRIQLTINNFREVS
ncbi:MAG: squalene/phytoene synthase family protein [bacterium]|nr:squalene/phytoene synthase family protein [bacterium]